MPSCVWENKSRQVPALDALREAQFYVKELHHSPARHTPSLPRLAVGFNGAELLISYLTPDETGVPVKLNGSPLKDVFVHSLYLANGISSRGALNSASEPASVQDLRNLLPRLKTIYRNVPPLTTDQGRTPIDFTVAMLTLRLLVEQHAEWGTWNEQPALESGSDKEHRIAQRLKTLVDKIEHDFELRERYGKILKFIDEGDGKSSFDFVKVVDSIARDQHHFQLIFDAFDGLPPLLNADFDLFGEVYQSIGDKATKKALGEFFTGRHIIAGVLPIFFARTGFDSSFTSLSKKKIADIACGTGGFLTETLRLAKRLFSPKSSALKRFAMNAFYGFDLGPTNASRARVNMYFAGDGFSSILGGVDALSSTFTRHVPLGGFDAVLTNPPYGQSSYGRTEEAFTREVVRVLKKGTGWGLLVLPTGVLENSRSASTRFYLLQHTVVTDVIELPKHAFAPYTLQQTAVVLFRKRANPVGVPEGDWASLASVIGHEEIACYVVDNDGYANSDKRYPTDRRDSEGRWLHDELREWIDQDSIQQRSDVYRACINRISPESQIQQSTLGAKKKYASKRLLELRNPEQGVVLLPDAILRRSLSLTSLSLFRREGNTLMGFLYKPLAELPEHWMSEVLSLLSNGLEFDHTIPTMCTSVGELFEVRKGDQGLTEEFIYQASDAGGIKVYGGGASEPKFRVRRDALRKDGSQITIHCGPKVIVAMDGTAGSMKVVNDEEFCLNHHAAVLYPYDPLLDGHWFVQQVEGTVKGLATNQKGSATLTKPSLEACSLTIPLGSELRAEIGTIRKNLLKLMRAL